MIAMRRTLAFLTACSTTLLLFDACVGDNPGAPSQLPQEGGPAEAGVTDAVADAPVTFCTSKANAFLCDDFERTDAVRGSWDDVVATDGGQLAIASEPSNRFLRVTIEPNDAGALRLAYLLEGSKKTISRATLELRLRHTGANAEMTTILIDLRRFQSGRTAYVAPMFELGNQIFLKQIIESDGAVSTERIMLAIPIPANTWHGLRMELYLDAQKRARLILDGAEVASAALGDNFNLGPVDALVGVAAHNGTPGTTIDFDDVVFEIVE